MKKKKNQINFLDLTLRHINNKIEFNIYRKPSTTHTTIPYNSNHPITHKLAVFHSMIHRAFSIPISEHDRSKEIRKIITITTENGFPTHLIQQIINKKHFKLAKNEIYPYLKQTKRNKFITLTYFGKTTERIAYTLQRQNHQIAFKSHRKLSTLLFNAKDATDPIKKSGVYKLTCSECNSVYIGQTGRNFETRYQEHFRSFRLKHSNSTFANHIIDCNHRFPKMDQLKILHTCEKGQKLNLLEALEIDKHRRDSEVNLLNEQTDLSLPLLTLA